MCGDKSNDGQESIPFWHCWHLH